jgi:2-haloacid dehalogenase
MNGTAMMDADTLRRALAPAFGMRVVWSNCDSQRPERLPGRPDGEITSLAELPALVGA